MHSLNISFTLHTSCHVLRPNQKTERFDYFSFYHFFFLLLLDFASNAMAHRKYCYFIYARESRLNCLPKNSPIRFSMEIHIRHIQKKPNMTSASSIHEKIIIKFAINGSVTEFNDVASAGVCVCVRNCMSSHQYQECFQSETDHHEHRVRERREEIESRTTR